MWLRGTIILFICLGLFFTFSILWVKQKYTTAQSQQILEKSLKVAGVKPEEGMFYTVDHKSKKIVKWDRIVK